MVENRIKTFLAQNPTAQLQRYDEEDNVYYAIANPWGDSSIELFFSEEEADEDNLFEALESLVLPPQLSAIWHSDLKSLEVIWTPRKLQSEWKEVVGRAFNFVFRGVEHKCEFRRSSDRLLTLAGFIVPVSTSETNFRNMQSFQQFVVQGDRDDRNFVFDEPLSFWIENLDWDEVRALELIRSLNFYMSYYDNVSPLIIIHDVSNEAKQVVQRTRYVAGSFPKIISARTIDENILAFWSAATSVTMNPMMKFILCYRIIECCASYFIENEIKSELKKIISAPNVGDNIEIAVERIASSVSKRHIEDIPRFKAVVRQCVDTRMIWNEIEAHKAFFSKKLSFEGGFEIRSLISEQDTFDTFNSKGLDPLSDSFRKIRNALSHGKDQETAGVILPTSYNMDALRRWVNIISAATGEVVLYRDVA